MGTEILNVSNVPREPQPPDARDGPEGEPKVTISIKLTRDLRTALRSKLHGWIRGLVLPAVMQWLERQPDGCILFIINSVRNGLNGESKEHELVPCIKIRFGECLFRLVYDGPAPLEFSSQERAFLEDLGREIDARHGSAETDGEDQR